LAEAFWRRVLEIEEAADARVALAKASLETGKLSEAELHLAKLFIKEPEHGEGFLLRGILAMQRNAYVEAGRAFERALAHQGDARKARLGIAMSAMGINQPARAWEALLHLLSDEPDDSEAMHWLIRAGTLMTRWQDLAERLVSYVVRNPADLHARFALCGVWVRLERMDQARQECDRLRALAPDYDGLPALEERIAVHGTTIASDHAA
jgi:thioredoxin-like negative regulator of GroEL